MPRYFFHVMDGRAIVDTEGMELDGIGDVRREAVRLAGAILMHEETSLVSGTPWHMTVADVFGQTVFSLRFAADQHGF